MGPGTFFKLVEIQTKVASVVPFLAASLYVIVRFQTFDPSNTILMFLALLAMDMFTTTLNNWMDYRRAVKREGYGFEKHNAIVRDGVSQRTVGVLVAILAMAVIGFGMALALRTGPWVWFFGALSFAVGILYSWGPLPISRTPLGELVSGGFMGYIIPLVVVLVHLPPEYFFLFGADSRIAVFQFNWQQLVALAMVMAPLFGGIANIMLANNICDQEDDKANGRLTLPVAVGTGLSLVVFVGFYLFGFVGIGAAALLGVLPLWYLGYLLLAVPVFLNVKSFFGRQIKAETFVLSVNNFLLLGSGLILLLSAQLFLDFF